MTAPFCCMHCGAYPDVDGRCGCLVGPCRGALLPRCRGLARACNCPLAARRLPVPGPPVDAQVEVLATTADLQVPFQRSVVSLGAAVSLRLGRLSVVLASKRVQTFHPEVFTRLGIDLASCKIVVVKSASPLPYRVRAAGRGHHLRELRRAVSAGRREDPLHPHPAADRAAGHRRAVFS